MKIKSFLWAFRLPRLPKDPAKTRQEPVRNAVRRASDGNILMQRGAYITQEDIQRAKKALRAT